MEDWMKALLQKNNENKVTASKLSPKKKVKVNIHLDTSADRRGGDKAASGHYRDRNRDRRAESRAPEAMASAPYNFVSAFCRRPLLWTGRRRKQMNSSVTIKNM